MTILHRSFHIFITNFALYFSFVLNSLFFVVIFIVFNLFSVNDSITSVLFFTKLIFSFIDFLSDGFDIETVVEIKRRYPNVMLLAITPLQSGATLTSALRAGIDSYIKKSCDIPEVIDAIEKTSERTSFYCGQILKKIRKESIDIHDLEVMDFSCDAIGLSKREKEVLAMIAEGHTNTKIAELLFLSAHTVTTHRKNIMHKLGVKNTAGIVMYAVKSGIVSPNRFLFSH